MAKQQPAIKLALPQSSQQKAGPAENSLVVTIDEKGELFLQDADHPVTGDTLQRRLVEAVQKNPAATLSIRADKRAPWGQVVKVMGVAKTVGIKVANAFMAPNQGQ